MREHPTRRHDDDTDADMRALRAEAQDWKGWALGVAVAALGAFLLIVYSSLSNDIAKVDALLEAHKTNAQMHVGSMLIDAKIETVNQAIAALTRELNGLGASLEKLDTQMRFNARHTEGR